MPDALPTAGTIGSDAMFAGLAGLAGRLVAEGQCDTRMIERATRVAADSGQRLDAVLLQLGLVTERGLATALAGMLNLPLVTPEHYPADEPVLAERLSSRFLRGARALPLGVTDGRVTVALVDPLDAFTPAAVALATGRAVALAVGSQPRLARYPRLEHH